MAFDDQFAGNFQNRERCQAQKVEFHQADGFHIVFIVLAHGRFAAGLLVEWAKIGELARCNQHAARVHTDIAGEAFQLTRQLHQGFNVFLFGFALRQNGLGFAGVDVFVAFFAVFGR